MKTTKNPAAVSLAKLSHANPPSPARKAASRKNGKNGGRSVKWYPAPKRGCENTMSELYRFTVVRLSDKAERFTDRKPSRGIVESSDFMVWDNRENCEVRKF